MREVREDLDTLAQGNIAAALRAGDARMTRWYSERRLRHEGYGNRNWDMERLADAQIEAFIASLGGDVEAFRQALAAFGVSVV
jgi:hypothetical protein